MKTQFRAHPKQKGWVFFMKWMSLWLLLQVMSPIWPLGPNPIPGDPFIVINKQTNQLVFYVDNQERYQFSIATGKNDEDTPEGLFTIITKFEDPEYSRKSIPGNDERNPLGSRWMGFDARKTNGRNYGIHGTNQEDSIGKKVSAGCIRMKNQEVQVLFELVPLGTKVYIYDNSEPASFYARLFHAINEKTSSDSP
ncbi:L,D-transpeptidase [Pradoshia sp. D12]|jgi:hypothetical protein|uniref:L,D-transpeptidase n=2 Tax=Bacillaceae TaxID=186817 RepID=UPI001CEF9D1F|nr:L,D-transpeptidase [Pradoshia sp. D12]